MPRSPLDVPAVPAEGAPVGAGPEDDDSRDLMPLLRRRMRRGAGPVLARTDATVLFDAGRDGCWTIGLRRGEIAARPGGRRHPTTRVSAPVEVLRDVIAGRRSGVEAFLAGELTVRGNLAIALQLDGVFDDTGLPPGHPRARMTLAAGIRTAYLEVGPRDAPPVVLVHGLGATNASFLPTLIELSRDYRVIAPDLPGHGASEAVRDSYHASFLGRWLNGFLDALELDNPVLVGNSLGGRTALESAFLEPDRVRGLALLAPAVSFRKWRQFVPLVKVLDPRLARLPIPINRLVATMELRRMFADPGVLPQTWYDAAIDESLRVLGIPSSRVAFFSALREVYLDEPFGELGFWDRLPTLKPPALFIWGDHDRLVPARFAPHVQAAVPAARSVVLARCGHVPQFEQPEQTHALIREFLVHVGSHPAHTTTPTTTRHNRNASTGRGRASDMKRPPVPRTGS